MSMFLYFWDHPSIYKDYGVEMVLVKIDRKTAFPVSKGGDDSGSDKTPAPPEEQSGPVLSPPHAKQGLYPCLPSLKDPLSPYPRPTSIFKIDVFTLSWHGRGRDVSTRDCGNRGIWGRLNTSHSPLGIKIKNLGNCADNLDQFIWTFEQLWSIYDLV